MFKYKLILTFLLVVLSLDFAIAEVKTIYQHNISIKRLGSHDGNFYFTLKEGFNVSCAWGAIYCYSNNKECKNLYAMALSSKLLNKKLAEIRYTHDSENNRCGLKLIAIE